MGAVIIFVLCSFVVLAQGDLIQVTLEADRPSLKVQLSHTAILECCYTTSKEPENTWIISIHTTNGTKQPQTVDVVHRRVTIEDKKMSAGGRCHVLILREVQFNDSGLYQCLLSHSVFSHGTFLQVYKPMEKTLNISESTKNKILTAEGILLLLCVLLPSATLLCKSKRLNELEKRKTKKEEENIYEGLNLDDCCTTYDQIQHSQVQNPYQDVGNIMEEEEDIQLEKP